jgi:hypothetical protein
MRYARSVGNVEGENGVARHEHNFFLGCEFLLSEMTPAPEWCSTQTKPTPNTGNNHATQTDHGEESSRWVMPTPTWSNSSDWVSKKSVCK